MADYEFWKDWKNKNKYEVAAIKSIKIAEKLILQNVPKDKIISIYAGGSFIRRDMNENSDVDILVVVKESKYLNDLKRLDKAYKEKYHPKISIGRYSLWELKHGKLSKQGGAGQAGPIRVSKHLHHLKLIYGKQLDPKKLFQISDKDLLEKTINTFNQRFIPQYNQKKMWFTDIVKSTFWLIEAEELVKGNNPPHSWKGLAKSIKDRGHIVQDALRYRMKKPKNLELRAEYIIKLKKYLARLQKRIKHDAPT